MQNPLLFLEAYAKGLVELFCKKKEVLYMSMPKTGKVVLKSQEQLCAAGQFPQSDFMEEAVYKQLIATLNVSFSLTPITMCFHKAQIPSRNEHHHVKLFNTPLSQTSFFQAFQVLQYSLARNTPCVLQYDPCLCPSNQ